MAIDTYGTLKSAVANWLARSDLTSVIPDFIALAENHMAQTLWLNKQLERDSAFSVTARWTALPTGCRRVKSVAHIYSSTRYDLPYLSPEQFQQVDAGETTAGLMQGYTVLGTEIGLHPTPSSATLELVYWPAITTLSDTTTSSDLLTAHPLLYLYRSCVEGAIYMRDDSLQARAEAHYARALMDALGADSWGHGTAPQMRVA